jgi:hypothetical protein
VTVNSHGWYILCSKLDDMGQAEVQLTYDRCLAKGNWNAWAADFEYLSGKKK